MIWLADLAIHRHTGRVEVGTANESSRVVFVVAESRAPHTAESCHRDQHRYAPFSCRFLLRSTTSCSCRLLISLTTFRSDEFSSTDGPALPLLPCFIDIPSTRRDSSVSVRRLVSSSRCAASLSRL